MIALIHVAAHPCKTHDQGMSNEDAAREIVLPGLVPASGVQIRSRGVPVPKRGEVVIAMEATGVSYAEVQMLRGRYPGQPAFPFVPGYDLVGRVRAVGKGVDASLVGKRVATMTAFGAWSDLVVQRAEALVVVPEELDPGEVETLIVSGVTAYKMLHRVARVRRGQTVLVHGAGGGVGTMLVQLAILAGAEVIGTCRPAQRAVVEALGARFVDYTRGEVDADVRALAPGGVDAVFDPVGGDSFDRSFELLRRGGYLVCYGNASLAKQEKTGSSWWPMVTFMGKKALWTLRRGGRKSTFFDVWGRATFGADHLFRPTRYWREFRADLGELVALLAAGRLQAHVARRFPLVDAASALAAHQGGAFTGKIVLEGRFAGRASLAIA